MESVNVILQQTSDVVLVVVVLGIAVSAIARVVVDDFTSLWAQIRRKEGK